MRRTPAAVHPANGVAVKMKLAKRKKPPFAYWGGKHYALSKIAYYVPNPYMFDTLTSPFCGGGSLEINAALNGYRVRAADMFEPPMTFYQVLTGRPGDCWRMINMIQKWDPQTKADWLAMRKRYWSEPDRVHRAAMFYCINNHSFSGLTFQDNTGSPLFLKFLHYHSFHEETTDSKSSEVSPEKPSSKSTKRGKLN